MKSLTGKSIKLVFSFFGLLAVVVLFNACSKDDDVDPGDTLIASFQYSVSADDFLTVEFQNFSQNATSYEWDFGDGNTSTEESPTHTYAEAGEYDVTLTARGAGGATANRSETITITDPDAVLTLLAGSTSKTWYLQREGIALGIGPVVNDNAWWSFGGATPLGDRPCILDDQYIFHRDGTFEFRSNGTIFIDAEANGGWLGPDGDEGCYDEAGNLTSANGDDLSAFGDGGNYTYEYNPNANTLTLLGEGAYIGLANKTETGDNFIPVSIKTYQVFNFAGGAIADSLQMSIVGNGFAWNFYLVSYKNEADLPAIPSTKPAADFSYVRDGNTVTFTNSSTNSTSYTWDFGDGQMSSEEDPVHTYADEGAYTVTLTAKDDMGNSDEYSEVVSISSAEFNAAALSSASGKVWKLAGEGSYKVGSFPGGGDFWPGLDAAGVMERACQMDDEFIFFDNGDFNYDAKGQVWAEPYMGGPNDCIEEADIPTPYDVFASGSHGFEVTEAAGNDPATIRVFDEGAFIGFNKPFNGGELDGSNNPASEIIYEVFDYTNVGGVETLVLIIDYTGTGAGWWTITVTTE